MGNALSIKHLIRHAGSDRHFFDEPTGIHRRALPGASPKAAVVLLCSLALAGCSLIGSKLDSGGGYRSDAVHDAPLDVPPDLSALSRDDRFAVPEQANSANALRSASGGGAAVSQAIAVRGANARLVRDGAQRWLAVDLPPEKTYEIVKQFWPSVGMKVEVDEPALGILETAWQEKHAKAPEGLVQKALNLFVETAMSNGEQDRFRARIERTPNDTSEIYISHRGLEEIYADEKKIATTWQPRPRDPELEAEMLQRLLLRFAGGDSAAPAASAKLAAVKDAGTVLPAVSHVVAQGAQSHLEVDEPFDRAWRRVGLALDRGGFTVEDRDRTKGVYFVRYLDQDYLDKQKQARGFFARIFESDPKVEAQQFRVALLNDGEHTSVRVQDKDGHPEAGAAGERILKRLDEQMR